MHSDQQTRDPRLVAVIRWISAEVDVPFNIDSVPCGVTLLEWYKHMLGLTSRLGTGAARSPLYAIRDELAQEEIFLRR